MATAGVYRKESPAVKTRMQEMARHASRVFSVSRITRRHSPESQTLKPAKAVDFFNAIKAMHTIPTEKARFLK